ncbi:MAG: Arm DNA-binding domain-containing protein, partial [Bacilli bacterium]
MGVYKDKARDTWYFRIRKRDIYGNVKEITRRGFNGKGEAKDAEARELLKPLEEKFDMSLNELWDKYIAYKTSRVKEATIITIKDRYNRHIKTEIGNLKIKSISVNKYMDFQNMLLKKDLSINYINNIHGDISSALKFGQKFINIDKNVANLVGPLADNSTKKEKTVWSVNDFKKFMDYSLKTLYNMHEYTLIKSIVMILSEYVLG